MYPSAECDTLEGCPIAFMHPFRPFAVLPLLALAFVPLLASPVASQQDGLPAGVTREQMWYAPSAQDWAKPCRITWQRTWEDALAVSLESGKAILVCVNMDGEIASEHYAGIRYRDAEIAQLYEPYVCVVASVYRHTPSDYDEAGERVECPRFHGVTCGEHITMEPILYEKFLDGRRVAPRHIMVELDGNETYDVFYAWDTDSVFRAIREGIEQRERQPNPPKGDRSLLERVASREASDRAAVEAAYSDGDVDLKQALLQAAIQNPQAEGTGLLRLALYDLDENLNKMARQGLAQSSTPGAIDLITEALRGLMPEDQRQGLVAALKRIGKDSVRARTLATVQEGLGSASSAVDAAGWARAMEGQEYPPPPGSDEIERRLRNSENATHAAPTDPAALLDLAVAALAFAVDPATVAQLARDPRTSSRYLRLYYQDALETALEAEAAGAADWQLDAVVAVAAYSLGDVPTAHQRAEVAVGKLPPGDPSWNAMAVMDIFADARRRGIAQAVRDKAEWPAEWMSELHATYSVLAQHPLGNVIQVMTHHDFLVALGAYRQAARSLQAGFQRYPESWDLHARYRQQLLRDRGVAALERSYQRWLERQDAPANLAWYAGFASIVAAETQRQANQGDAARAAYERALGLYQRAIERNPSVEQSSNTYMALALAGRARIAMDAQHWQASYDDLLASFALDPGSANVLDGLNFSAFVTATTLHARLLEAGQGALAQSLQEAIDALPPKARQRPAYDTPGAPSQDAQRFGSGGGGG